MSASDRAAQEEFLHKAARLYRAVSGALRTSGEVTARLKSIREALRETPAVEKPLIDGERFSFTKPTQTHVDDYNIAAEEFAEQLDKLHALVEVDLAKL